MGKTNAEKQRLYRQRRDADLERRNEYLLKRKQKYAQDVSVGRRQRIGDKSPRDQRLQRRIWRQQQQNSRHRKKFLQLTPPPTPDLPLQDNVIPRQRQQGRRRTARERSRVYRENARLKDKVNQQTRVINRYKKRLSRISKSPNATQSPRTKTKNLLRHIYFPPEKIRKVLNFHHALTDQLRQRYKASKSEREKVTIKRLISGRIIRKYKFNSLSSQIFGFSRRFTGTDVNVFFGNNRKSRAATELRAKLNCFYLRDDVSRIATGKKNTVTLKKVKRQRRLLQDSLQNLHLKFLAEHNSTVSYTFFCSMRPFFVVAPTERDRETCLCMTHENIQFMIDELYCLNITDTKNLNSVLDEIVCDKNSKDCAYADCDKCVTKAYQLKNQPSQNQVTVYQWQRKKTQRKQKNSEEILESFITVKEEIQIQEDELVAKFQSQLDRFKKHAFNIRHQFAIYQELRQGLADNECLIHIDFSEDYQCRYATEIQSVHFGGSHQQACIHTGVLYLSSSRDALPFASISDSTRHDPPAIWAHLDPILSWIHDKQPKVNTIHFFSDSPSTQYRQKANFFLMSTEPFRKDFTTVTWNFFEASHGKEAPDGVGGSLKRTADKLTREGKDVESALSLYNQLQAAGSSVNLYFVESRM